MCVCTIGSVFVFVFFFPCLLFYIFFKRTPEILREKRKAMRSKSELIPLCSK